MVDGGWGLGGGWFLLLLMRGEVLGRVADGLDGHGGTLLCFRGCLSPGPGYLLEAEIAEAACL